MHQPPWSLGSIPKREEPGKTGRHPVLKYRVPHGSHHTCVMGRLVHTGLGSSSLVAHECPPMSPPTHTNRPGVLGSIPKREEPGKTGRHPVLKYLGFFTGPTVAEEQSRTRSGQISGTTDQPQCRGLLHSSSPSARSLSRSPSSPLLLSHNLDLPRAH